MKAWAIQLFDEGGYYGAVVEMTRVDACAIADARTLRVACVACSLPFEVDYRAGRATNVSLPDAWRSELAHLERGKP